MKENLRLRRENEELRKTDYCAKNRSPEEDR